MLAGSDTLCLRLSALAAAVLADSGKLKLAELEPHRPKEYDTHKPATDPVTGGASEILRTVANYYKGIGTLFINPPKGVIDTATAIPKVLFQSLEYEPRTNERLMTVSHLPSLNFDCPAQGVLNSQSSLVATPPRLHTSLTGPICGLYYGKSSFRSTRASTTCPRSMGARSERLPR
jgi:hypothetical protein